MEIVPFNPLLQVTPEEVTLVRRSLDLNKDVIKKSIDVILEWWKKQDHLVDVLPFMDDSVIERFLIISKGSVEGAKTRIDNVLTTRGLLPEITLNKTFEEFDHLLKNIFCFSLPKTNPKDHTRVFIMENMKENSHEIDFAALVRFAFMVSEFRMFFDYNFSDRYILNFKNFTPSMLAKFNPFLFKKGETLCTQSYGIKVKGIHILHPSPFVEKFIVILKQVLSEKLTSRLYVHKSYEELHQEVSKEILPEDYGGNGASIKKLREQWGDYFKSEEARQVLNKLNKVTSNESKRTNIKFNEEYLGTPGSFRKLTLD